MQQHNISISFEKQKIQEAKYSSYEKYFPISSMKIAKFHIKTKNKQKQKTKIRHHICFKTKIINPPNNLIT